MGKFGQEFTAVLWILNELQISITPLWEEERMNELLVFGHIGSSSSLEVYASTVYLENRKPGAGSCEEIEREGRDNDIAETGDGLTLHV